MSWSVLGSGVTGFCVATALIERGESCEVIENPQYIPASYWAGGMLAPYCESESAPKYVQEYGFQAIQWWVKHSQSVQQNGTLVVAPPRDQSELKRFAHLTQSHTWVSPQAIEPALSDTFEKGLFFADEAHLNPRRALAELKEHLIKKGVVFHSNPPNEKILDCTGMGAQPEFSDLRAVRGEMLILQSEDVVFSRPIRFLHPRFPCYLVPRENGQFMLGATMVESSNSGKITARALLELLGSLYVLNPAFMEAKILETGTGLRPSFPQNLPEIRYQDGRFFINGMYRHGFLLAPIMAENLMQKLEKAQ